MYLDTRQDILHFRKVDVHCTHHDVSLEYWHHVFSKYYAQCYTIAALFHSERDDGMFTELRYLLVLARTFEF